MNIASFAIRNRKITYVLSFVAFAAGVWAYLQLGRLEMPDFTIKIAAVATSYPGASPSEVESEVTQRIEEALQQLPDIKELYSTSQEGMSIVYIEMAEKKKSSELPQIWDELRRKVGDCQGSLPPGAGPSIVNDDFGDVYGLFYALSLKEDQTAADAQEAVSAASQDAEVAQYDPSLRRLRLFCKELRKEVLLCRDVKRVEFCGQRQDVVYLDFRDSKLRELGIPAAKIASILQSQNVVSQSGKVEIGDQYVRISPSGDFSSLEDVANLLVSGANGETLRLGEIVDVRRGYYDPPTQLAFVNGKPAIGFGVSTRPGGNAVEMTKAVEKRIAELQSNGFFPDDIEIATISNQGATVTESLNGFVVNLIESVAIVVGLLALFMGVQSGLLIGVVLLLNIFATFIYMYAAHISLQIISLGALILALGMLVDNAIVVAEGTIIGVQRGQSREEAAVETVRRNQWALLGATVIAILAFAAISFAPGNTGEACISLFCVMTASLLLSWVFAVTTTPLLCVDFLKIPPLREGADPYDKPFFRVYRRFLEGVLRRRGLALATVVGILFFSLWAFKTFVPTSFFPDNPRRQFFIDLRLPEGSPIELTNAKIAEIERMVKEESAEFDEETPAVLQFSRFVGGSPLRFMLAYDVKDPNADYAQLIVNVRDKELVMPLKKKIEDRLHAEEPDLDCQVHRFVYTMPCPYRVECYLRGPDPEVLHQLSEATQKIMREEGAWDVCDDWRNPVTVVRPTLNETRARFCGIGRADVATALQARFNGIPVGVYREGEDLTPMIARAADDLRQSYANVGDVQVVSSATGIVAPLSQLVEDPNATVVEDPIIKRRRQVKTIAAHCNPSDEELPSTLLARVKPRFEKEIAPNLPAGYDFEWSGEYKTSNEAGGPLVRMFPVCLGLMFLILICQFNEFRPPIVIFLTLPLSIIGVTLGLIVAGLPMGFMAMLGFLGLSGMLIKNGIVLVEQIRYNLETVGLSPYDAVLEAAVSRLRPVSMAAGTTVLGMAPLVRDAFYSAMAATVAGGLIGATALTLIVIPIFYAYFYRIPSPKKARKRAGSSSLKRA